MTTFDREDLLAETPPADGPARFANGKDRMARLLNDPADAADIAQARAEIHQMDREHAMTLAMIRKAGELTQGDVAQRLGIGQGRVSRVETSDDMLLSTLFDYLHAAGAVHARIVVSLEGRGEVDLDLATLRHRA